MDPFQSHDHEELTKNLVVRPDGEPDNMDGETFYCDDYEQITGRNRDGSIRDGGNVEPITETVEVPGEVTAKVVTAAPKSEPRKSTAKTK